MRRAGTLLAALLLACPVLSGAVERTIAWDADAGWPADVQVELQLATGPDQPYSHIACQTNGFAEQATVELGFDPPWYWRARAIDPADPGTYCDVAQADGVSVWSERLIELAPYAGADITPVLPWNNTSETSEPQPMADPVFIGSANQTNLTDAHTSISITHGLEIEAGDLVLLIVGQDPYGSPGVYGTVTATGFTEVINQVCLAENAGYRWQKVTVFRRIAIESEPASYTADFSLTMDDTILGVMVYRNVDTSDPVPTATSDASGSASGTVNIPAITMQHEKSLRVAIVGHDGEVTLPNNTNRYSGWGASLTERLDRQNHWVSLGAADVQLLTAGAQPATTVSQSANSNWIAISLEIKAAPVLDATPDFWWKLNETSGSVAVNSGDYGTPSDYNGTVFANGSGSTAWLGSSETWGSGGIQGGIELSPVGDGTTNPTGVTINTNLPLDGLKRLTLSVWSENDGTGAGDGRLFFNGRTWQEAGHLVMLGYSGFEDIRTRINGATQLDAAGNEYTTAKVHWTMVIDYTLGTEQLKLYKDGVKVYTVDDLPGTEIDESLAPDGTGGFVSVIGASSAYVTTDRANSFGGKIADMRVWLGQAATDSEVNAIKNDTLGSSGSTAYNYNAAGGLSTGGAATTSSLQLQLIDYSASGGLTAGGSATVATRLIYPYAASGGVSSAGAATTGYRTVHPYSASGGLSAGGAATTAHRRVYPYAASGGLSGSGAATVTHRLVYPYAPAGGLTAGGTATTSTSAAQSYSASGGLSTGGAATVSHTRTYTPGGGLTASGAASAAHRLVYPYTAAGGVSSGGTATTSTSAAQSYSASGGLNAGGAAAVSHTRVQAASGGLTAGGSAASGQRLVYPYIASGGLSSGGAASTGIKGTAAYSASGGLTAGGAASTGMVARYSYLPSGGLGVSGAATAGQSARFSYAPSGGISAGGAASTAARSVFVYTASGGLSTGGAAQTTNEAIFAYTGTGGLSTGGAASTASKLIHPYTGTGGLTAGGAASTSSTQLQVASYSASGGAALAGTAATGYRLVYGYAGTGGLTAGGAAQALYLRRPIYSASGGLNVTGGAALAITKAATAMGGLVSGGAALLSHTRIAPLPAGGLVSGGAAATFLTRPPEVAPLPLNALRATRTFARSLYRQLKARTSRGKPNG